MQVLRNLTASLSHCAFLMGFASLSPSYSLPLLEIQARRSI